MPGLRTVQARHADGFWRRAVARSGPGRRGTTGRRGGQGRPPLCRAVRPIARPRVRCGRHRPPRRLRHQCSQALQMGARVAIEAAHSQNAERGRGARLPPLARARDRARPPGGDRRPRRDRRESAARPEVQRHEGSRPGAAVALGGGRLRHGPSIGGAPRAARAARARRAHVLRRSRHRGPVPGEGKVAAEADRAARA